MYPENKEVFDRLNITNYHKAGLKGKGVNICVYDTNFNPDDLPHGDIFKDVKPLSRNALQRWTDEDDHGVKVLDVVRQIAPEANIYYYAMDDAQYWMIFNDLEDAKIDVFTTSIGRFTYPSVLAKRARESKTILFAAAGNDAEGGLIRPAREKEWIAVGATHDGVNRAGYSSIGEGLEVMGMSGLYVKNKSGEKQRVFGTSFASPAVAAMTALYLSGNRIDKHDARDMIARKAEDMSDPGRDKKTGYGLFVLPDNPKIVVTEIQVKKEGDVIMPNFTDIENHWAKDSIERIAKLGYVNGYNDNTYRPDQTVTRAELAAILDRFIQDQK